MTTTARPDHPLYLHVPMRHRVQLPVLGIPVRFESNSSAVIDAVEATFSVWRPVGRRRALISSAPVRVRLIVHEGREESVRRVPITYRLPDPDWMVVHTRGSLGIADAQRREAIGYVTPALLAQSDHFCFGFLEPLVLVLVTQFDRHPVHASVVGRGSTALILAGPAGTGKSTLAYAASRAGMSVLTDDSAYLQVRPTFRLWGMPGRVYLPPESRRRFAELSKRKPERLANGKTKLAVDVPQEWASGVPIARRVGVCLLERRGGPVRRSRVGARALRMALWRGLGLQQAIHQSTAEPALSRLCAGGGWRLHLSNDPRDAVPYIERMLAELEVQA